jgi:acyl carrier protein
MIMDRLFAVIRRVKKDDVTLRPQSRFVDDLGLDSLTVMELVAEVEDEFDINLPLNLLPEIHTVADLAATIDRLRGPDDE